MRIVARSVEGWTGRGAYPRRDGAGALLGLWETPQKIYVDLTSTLLTRCTGGS